MKLGVVVESISSLKVLGAFLEQGPGLGFDLVVFVPDWRKGKPYDTVTVEMLVNRFEGVKLANVLVYETGQLLAAVLGVGVSDLLLLNPYRNFVDEVSFLAGAGVRVHGLDYFANSVYVAASEDDSKKIDKCLDGLSSRMVNSDWWRDFEMAVVPDHAHWLDKFVGLGTPLIDGMGGMEADVVRSELGLDPKKPIVAVFTPNIRDHQAYFFYGVGTWAYLRRLAWLLRSYCDARGYQLVVKSREKQWDATPFLHVADVAVQDMPGQLYPSTSARLLAVSSLAVHFGSMMVMEAAAVGVPSVAVEPEYIDKLHGYMRPEVRGVAKEWALVPKEESLFGFAGVSESASVVEGRRQLYARFDRLVAGREDLARFDAFNTKFSGWRAGSTVTERVLEYVSNSKQGEGAHVLEKETAPAR